MNYLLLLIIPGVLGFFVGLWLLIVKGLAMAGWQRLATHYQVPELPPGPRFYLPQASVGGVRYKGAIEGSVSCEGLGLSTGFPFNMGHKPVLIPWSAIGPFKVEKALWATTYTTTVHTPDAGTVSLMLVSETLMASAQPWVRLSAESQING